MKRSTRAQQGYTLIELIVVVTILAAITGGITSAFLTAYNANATSDERVHESNDAQLIAGYWTADAQAAGGSDPVSGATDNSLGVSTGSDNGCTDPNGGTLVFSFKWKDRSASAVTTRVANYFYRASTSGLERRACAGGVTSAIPLASRVVSLPTTSCLPSCSGLPNEVTITIAEAASATAAHYDFSLTAKVRPDGQTAPTSSSAASSPLIALGGAPCNSGDTTTGVEIGGSPTVNVNGGTVINAADQGSCPAFYYHGSPQFPNGGVSIVPGGNCSGSGACSGFGITTATPISDPFAGFPRPSTSGCAGGSNPAPVGGVYPSGVTYPTLVTLSGSQTFAPGNVVLCNGLAGSSTGTSTGVFLYIAGGVIAHNVDLFMTAPASGTYANLAIWNGTNTSWTFDGNNTINIQGALYAPTADIIVAGGPQRFTVSVLVVRRAIFTGSSGTTITGSGTPPSPVLTATTSTTTLRAVDLSWTPRSYPGMSAITSFQFRADRGSGLGAWTTIPGGGSVTTYTDTCGTSDTVATTCQYQVRAINAAGNGSPSNLASAPSFADGTAPTVTVTAPAAGTTVGRTATLSGTAGNATGDSATVTVKVYGSANCTGGFVQASTTRAGSAWSVAISGLTDGAKSVCASQSDWVGNTGTSAPVAFTVAPVLGMAVTNSSGRIGTGDSVAITFGQAMNAGTFCAGWNGTTARNTLTVTINNNDVATGGNDSLTITDSACAFNFGRINLGSTAWVSAPRAYTTSTAVMNAGLTTLTITLGSGANGSNGNAATPMTWTPSGSILDSLGATISGSFAFPNLRF